MTAGDFRSDCSQGAFLLDLMFHLIVPRDARTGRGMSSNLEDLILVHLMPSGPYGCCPAGSKSHQQFVLACTLSCSQISGLCNANSLLSLSAQCFVCVAQLADPIMSGFVTSVCDLLLWGLTLWHSLAMGMMLCKLPASLDILEWDKHACLPNQTHYLALC